MGITGDCGIIVVVVMVMVLAFVRVVVVIRSNLFNIVFGSGICGVGSGSGLSSGCCVFFSCSTPPALPLPLPLPIPPSQPPL